MTLSITLRWQLDGLEVEPRLLHLLRAIDAHGSLQQATREVGLSYRHSWDMLGRFEQAAARRVVELQRGRGARLTPFGHRLAHGARDIETRLAAQLKTCAHELDHSFGKARMAVPGPLVMSASHDLALGSFVQSLVRRKGPRVDLRVMGSVDALTALARKQCALAGFHVPHLRGEWSVPPPYRPWLGAKTLRLLHFADRQQGLMVAKQNPMSIAALGDLVKRRARFVNRQPGSGTRICFDALLAAHHVRPDQIAGYASEEFTHAAVAAMVASGAADAGFGIEAAAAAQGLAFIPLVPERYFLAAQGPRLAEPDVRHVIEALSSRWFRALVRELPGYRLPRTPVEAVSPAEAFMREPPAF